LEKAGGCQEFTTEAQNFLGGIGGVWIEVRDLIVYHENYTKPGLGETYTIRAPLLKAANIQHSKRVGAHACIPVPEWIVSSR